MLCKISQCCPIVIGVVSVFLSLRAPNKMLKDKATGR